MKIREAVPEDLDQLLELYRLLEEPYENDEHLTTSEAEDIFTRILLDPNQKTLVAEHQDEVVGTLVVAILPNLGHSGSPYAVVENVVVNAGYQGTGVGTTLMQEAVRSAREAGAYKLALCSHLDREDSHTFYRSLGMKQTHAGFEVKL